jgi:hypothetical protein
MMRDPEEPNGLGGGIRQSERSKWLVRWSFADSGKLPDGRYQLWLDINKLCRSSH